MNRDFYATGTSMNRETPLNSEASLNRTCWCGWVRLYGIGNR